MYRSVSYPDFSQCLPKNTHTSDDTIIMLVLIVIVGSLCAVGIVLLICFMRGGKCWRKMLDKCKNTSTMGEQIRISAVEHRDDTNIEQCQPEAIQPSLIPESVRVYVVFMDDHDYHKEVVHCFCSYLKEDLGLDVRLNIWQEREVAANAISYMDVNLKLADKVIVICSEGSKNCLSQEEYDGNMFTPVVRNICQQSFIGYNPGKFLVGYFEYGNVKDIPEILYEQCMMYNSSFKLMKQFEQFYFRLVGVEQYQDGGIQRIEEIAYDRYFDSNLTKQGKSLKEAIDRMKYFVQDHPTWYTDRHGSDQPQSNAIPPPPPVPRPLDSSRVQDRSILDSTPSEASISRLNTAPPPELRNGMATAPKLPNGYPPTRQTQRQRPLYTSQTTQNAGRYQPLSSMTSASTESSYVVQTEVEDLSSSPGIDSTTDNDEESYHYPARHRSGGSDLFHSYHPESFNDNDFRTLEGNSIDSRLIPSNETQITRLGLTPSMERLREANGMLDPFLSIEPLEENGSHPPESVVITLADVEEPGDVEELFKSINQSDC